MKDSKKRFENMSVKEKMAYYKSRRTAMENSESITYADSGNTHTIKSLNFDTFVRIVDGRAVPSALIE